MEEEAKCDRCGDDPIRELRPAPETFRLRYTLVCELCWRYLYTIQSQSPDWMDDA